MYKKLSIYLTVVLLVCVIDSSSSYAKSSERNLIFEQIKKELWYVGLLGPIESKAQTSVKPKK